MLTGVFWAATSVGVGVGVYFLAEQLESTWLPTQSRHHCWAIKGSGIPTPLPDLADHEDNYRFSLELLDEVSELLVEGKTKKSERLMALAVALSENRWPILRMANHSLTPRVYNRLLVALLEIDRGWDCIYTRNIT